MEKAPLAVVEKKGTSVPSYAWIILLVALLAGVAAPFNQFKVPPLMPVLMQRFQLDLGTAGLLMSIFSITGFVLALPAGLILQRLGPKVAGLIAVGCLAIGSALGTLAAGAGFLLATRLIEGAGMGLISVVSPALIAIWFPPEKRGGPMGVWGTWVPLGSLIMFNYHLNQFYDFCVRRAAWRLAFGPDELAQAIPAGPVCAPGLLDGLCVFGRRLANYRGHAGVWHSGELDPNFDLCGGSGGDGQGPVGWAGNGSSAAGTKPGPVTGLADIWKIG
jgi:MFS family permease